jgi:hypothetical protein
VKGSKTAVTSTRGEKYSNYLTLERFFNECISAAKAELFKSQKVALNPNKGLAGSLFFELMYTSQNDYRRNNPIGII